MGQFSISKSRNCINTNVGSNEQMRFTTATLLTTLILLTVDTVGQERKVLTGITTDGHRNGLLGINVMIKGTATGTVTDICGRFSIPVDSDEFTLLFHGLSYDDMRTYEIKIGKADITTDTLVFQLGRWKLQNTDCEKVNKKLRKKVIE